MHCRICGTEDDVTYHQSKYLAMCGVCNRETPRKASRASFERRYWGKDVDSVPRSTRNEFWSDYLASSDTLTAYIDNTTEAI